jgi:hypothetical protein
MRALSSRLRCPGFVDCVAARRISLAIGKGWTAVDQLFTYRRSKQNWVAHLFTWLSANGIAAPCDPALSLKANAHEHRAVAL